MTTIAYKDGIMAADSRCTVESEASNFIYNAEKILIKRAKKRADVKPIAVLGFSGDSTAGLVFFDWYASGAEPPTSLAGDGSDAEIAVLIWTPDDGLWFADTYCRPEPIHDEFYAVGSGGKVALGAMAMGATAQQAVEIAMRFDAYTGGRIQVVNCAEVFA